MTRPTCLVVPIWIALLMLLATPTIAAEFTAKLIPSGDASPSSGKAWEIKRDGRLVTIAHSDLKGTPGLYPLYSPTGLALTRAFPVAEPQPLEKRDHDHHRSMWFTHGMVNDLDFWIDDDKPHVGRVVELTSNATQSGSSLVLETTNQWQDPNGVAMIDERRSWTFHEINGDTVIDFDTTMTAVNSDVVMGDTKEGSLGIRVAGSMKVDAGFGGRIINSEGLTDKAAWAQASDWVDYSGPVATDVAGDRPTDDEIASWPMAGITILAHPDNDVTPTRWHVRTYGLFAANPFGRHHFGQPAYDGVTITSDKPLHLSYRIVLHDGPHDDSSARAHFDAYESSKANRR